MKLGRALRQAEQEHTAKVRARGRGRTAVEWLHRVDIADMLERMEVEHITRSGHDEFNFSCPFPGHSSGDSRPSGYMNDGSSDQSKATVWKCHGCGRAGNAITFVAEHEGITKQKATQWLRELYASDFRAPKGGISAEFEERLQRREREAELDPDIRTISWKRYDKLFEVDWHWAAENNMHEPAVAYLLDRGFTPDTLTSWRIGYDPISQRLTIPVTNIDGELVGIKGRTWQPKSKVKNKYMILGDKPGMPKRYGFGRYEKSRVVFGLDRWFTEGKLVLVEGELDVIALAQIGIAAVCTGSSSVSREQAVMLRDYADELVLYFDLDNAGINAIAGYQAESGEWKPGLVERLGPFMRVNVIVNHDGDPAFYQEHERASEIFELVRNAVPAHKLLLD